MYCPSLTFSIQSGTPDLVEHEWSESEKPIEQDDRYCLEWVRIDAMNLASDLLRVKRDFPNRSIVFFHWNLFQ
jgi:hypothetical protein